MRLILLLLLSGTLCSQNLLLKRGNKIRNIRPFDEVTVFSEKRALKNDSIELMGRGRMHMVVKDTLILRAWEFASHNYYKRHDDSLHFIYEELRDSIVTMKFPLKEITGIYKHRTRLTRAMTSIVFVTAGASLLTVPAMLLLGPGETRDAVTAFNLTSSSVMLTAATTGILFNKKRYWFYEKAKKRWEIVKK